MPPTGRHATRRGGVGADVSVGQGRVESFAIAPILESLVRSDNPRPGNTTATMLADRDAARKGQRMRCRNGGLRRDVHLGSQGLPLGGCQRSGRGRAGCRGIVSTQAGPFVGQKLVVARHGLFVGDFRQIGGQRDPIGHGQRPLAFCSQSLQIERPLRSDSSSSCCPLSSLNRSWERIASTTAEFSTARISLQSRMPGVPQFGPADLQRLQNVATQLAVVAAGFALLLVDFVLVFLGLRA